MMGGVDAARDKVESRYGGVFKLLSAAEKRPSGLTSWLFTDKFDVKDHALKVSDENPHLPPDLYLISSGAWPRSEPPMAEATRKAIGLRIKENLEKSETSWKLFCDTDGDRRPSPYTLIGYQLCSQAIVPLHLNKGDMDRTETMLGCLHDLRSRGEIQTQVLFIVWNFVQVTNNTAIDYRGMQIPFTPTAVSKDIMDACNKRMFATSKDLPGLFVHDGAGDSDFIKNSTAALRQLADSVIKPSEELGMPVSAMVKKLQESGKKSVKHETGSVTYTTSEEQIKPVMAGLEFIEERFEAMMLSAPAGTGGYAS